jgi:streptogramin lyase
LNLARSIFGQLIFFCFFLLNIEGQKLSLQSYNVADGLANSTITSIHQDKKGFIWFGTWEGLSRFDGYGFVNYGMRDGLGHPMINDVGEDKEGRLWVATNGGGVALKTNSDTPEELRVKTKGKFISFRLTDFQDANRVNQIVFDSFNNLWCLTDFGLYRANLNDLANLKFEVVIDRESGGSGSLIEDSRGRIWVGLREELFEIKNGQIINHGSSNEAANILLGSSGEPGNFITGIIETKDGKILVSTLAALYEFSGGRWLKHPIVLDSKKVFTFFEDSGGSLWLGVYGEKSEIIKYQNGRQESYATRDGVQSVVEVFAEDRDGNLWFGGPSGGVIKFGGYALVNYFEPGGFFSLTTSGVFEDFDGKIYGATSGKSLIKSEDYLVNRLPRKQNIPLLARSASVMIVKNKTYWYYDYWYLEIKQPVVIRRNGQRIELKKYFTDAELEKGVAFYEDENETVWLLSNYRNIYK